MTEQIKIAQQNLYINNKLVYTFIYNIKNFLIIKDKLIVLLEIPEQVIYNENLFCFDLEGNFLWQIEGQKEHQEDCHYTGISYNDGNFTPYKWCGILAIVNLENGKILSSRLIK